MLASLSAMMGGSTKAVPLAQAQSIALEGAKALGCEKVLLGEAPGRVIREEILTGSPYPEADLSAMDGYCLASEDVAGADPSNIIRLRVTATLRAGEPAQCRIGQGECMEIMTGAGLPEGADTVVPSEMVEEAGGFIALSAPSPPGFFVRKRGGILATGQRIELGGRRASPQVISLLAALGISRIAVTRRPRVALIATGDELVLADRPLGPCSIRPSNLAMLDGLVRAAGCLSKEARISRDSESEIAEHINGCAECDAVVLSGGIAGGKFDLVKSALRSAGASIRFEEVLMSPGKRSVLARKEDTIFICLPGNPLAALVAFQAIALPVLLALLGLKDPFPRTLGARLKTAIGGEAGKGRTRFIPGRILEGFDVEPIKVRAAGDILSLADTTCLIRLEPDAGGARAGDIVGIWPVPEGVVC
jgi:molybdopterin molybdotransferase